MNTTNKQTHMPFLTSRAPPLEMKGRVYASCVRSSMPYGSETRSLLVDVGLKFERAEIQVIRWMCGISLKDSSSVQPPRTCLSPLSLVHPPPKTPTRIQPPKTSTSSPLAPTLQTEYNLHVPTLPTYPHHTNFQMSPPQLLTSPHLHTRNKKKTSKQNTKRSKLLNSTQTAQGAP